MGLVMGIDPGTKGALSIVGDDGRVFSSVDMPAWDMPIGKQVRKRVDAVGLADQLELAKMLGVELVVIEAVGGRPKQSASSGFVFGYSTGLIYMACIQLRLAIETVPPQTWKKMLNVPGKAKGEKLSEKEKTAIIMSRAQELFPHDYDDMFLGPAGGRKVDRAEAAMLALFGVKYVQHVAGDTSQDVEWNEIYRNAKVGAG